MLQNIVQFCCGEHGKVLFSHQYEHQQDMESFYKNETFLLPVAYTTLGMITEPELDSSKYLPVIESPGEFVMKYLIFLIEWHFLGSIIIRNKKKFATTPGLDIIIAGWPLLLLIIISALYAGLFMWILVNPGVI